MSVQESVGAVGNENWQNASNHADQHVNGNGLQEDSSRSAMVSPGPFSEHGDAQSHASQQPSYNDHLCHHLWEFGFRNALYTDMIIRFHVPPETAHAYPNTTALEGFQVKLHRILAIRSPFLMQQLELIGEAYQQQLPIMLPIQVQDPNLLPEGIMIALGYLYGSFQLHALQTIPSENPSIRSARLRATLAAANLFQLHDLLVPITEYIKNDITSATVIGYCQFVSQMDWGGSYATAEEIRSTVREYLMKGVVREFGEGVPVWANKEAEGYRELVRLFADLPYEWLKRVVENKGFEVPTEMERFNFAKEVIGIRSARNKRPGSSLLAGEENVLLTFGGNKSGGSAVTIVRKAPKGQHQSQGNGIGGAPGLGGVNGAGAYPPERRVWKAGSMGP
ncbi:hypothetical protein HDV00_012524 [Rhizophlyctis rosea]|nr:hypothetical protein HDV00_012524 [Rhizophlyctis rosea]